MTLWRRLNVPIPSPASHTSPIITENQETLLIWGGSTTTGQFAIQLARLSGIRVIAVTSTRTASLARELGAEVITRNRKTNEEIVAEINVLSRNSITKAIDLVGPKTASYCLQTFSTAETGKRKLFAPLAMMSPKQDVPDNVKVVAVEMKQFVLDKGCRMYAERLNELVEGERISVPRVVVLEGGLAAVELGLERLKSGEMGERKLVVSM
jgi:NADPH:quinone reductase-like Zn-dependent oxidoreductase